MKSTAFPYSSWTKVLGLLIILAGTTSFFIRYQKNNVFDMNELAVGFSWGFIFIFFSREKTDDEMIHVFKYRALSRAVIIAFFITHLYNYIFLNWRFTPNDDLILSISAYQFLALTLMIATGIFYYLKHQTTLIEGE